jgi:hypothetical protein
VVAILMIAVVVAWSAWAVSVFEWQRSQALATAAKAVFLDVPKEADSSVRVEKVTGTNASVSGIGRLFPPLFEFNVAVDVVMHDGHAARQQVVLFVLDGHQSVAVSAPNTRARPTEPADR